MILYFQEKELSCYSYKILNKLISQIRFNKSTLVCTLLYNDIHRHSGQNVVDSLGYAS